MTKAEKTPNYLNTIILILAIVSSIAAVLWGYYFPSGIKTDDIRLTHKHNNSVVYKTYVDSNTVPKELYLQIEKHEGKHYTMYTDKLGNDTIGIGFNLEYGPNLEALERYGIDINAIRRGEPIDERELLTLFAHSYNTALEDVKSIFGEKYDEFPENIQFALIDMAFNMGRGKLLEFDKMIYHLNRHQYQYAAGEVMHSKWYKQVGTRGVDIYYQIHP